jgi:hypothetical protein
VARGSEQKVSQSRSPACPWRHKHPRMRHKRPRTRTMWIMWRKFQHVAGAKRHMRLPFCISAAPVVALCGH